MEVTSAVLPIFTKNYSIAELEEPSALFTAAKKASESETAKRTLHLEHKNGLLSHTHYVATAPAQDADVTQNMIVADLTSEGLLSFGKWTIKFPATQSSAGEETAAAEVHMRPAGAFSPTDYFVHDGVSFLWEMIDLEGPGYGQTQRVCRLFKATEGKRREVTRFMMERRWDKNHGVLVLQAPNSEGEGGVDEIVACVTCVATVHRVESFRA